MKTPWTILMIEDSASDAELALRAFRYAAIANPLRIVSSGEEGLAALWDAGGPSQDTVLLPGVILLDLNLPGMPGIEFLRRIKADERTRTLPVVVLSLSEADRNIMACVRLGSDGYIVKPLDPENLIRVLAKLKLTLTLLPPPASERKARAV